MNETNKLVQDTIKAALIGAALLTIVFALFFRTQLVPLLIGLFFGVSVSIFSFIDLKNTMERACEKGPAEAQSYTVRKYFIRYIINGVVIYVAVVTSHLHILSTVLGMLLIKVSIMITNLLNDKQFYKNIFKRREV